ncbi:hypothetical protein KIL84_019641 [Mauremys mutica]|uniref:Uncharacterized protein n=1 Tax=Mauremys mutica TaxID=74926 RepID=A0A9D3XVN4_9SAUR|nr:hypothetical protein KIL84_019641 [Mauremys mutica]
MSAQLRSFMESDFHWSWGFRFALAGNRKIPFTLGEEAVGGKSLTFLSLGWIDACSCIILLKFLSVF